MDCEELVEAAGMKKWRELKAVADAKYSTRRLFLWSRMATLCFTLLATASYGYHTLRHNTIREILSVPQERISSLCSLAARFNIDDYGSSIDYLNDVLAYLESNTQNIDLMRDVLGSSELRTIALDAFKRAERIDATKFCKCNFRGQEFHQGLMELADARFWDVLSKASDADTFLLMRAESIIPLETMGRILRASGYRKTNSGYWEAPSDAICWAKDSSHHIGDYASQLVRAIQASIKSVQDQYSALVQSEIQPVTDACQEAMGHIDQLGMDLGHIGLMVFGIMAVGAALVYVLNLANKK